MGVQQKKEKDFKLIHNDNMTIYAGQVRHGTHGEATATLRPTKTIPMLSEARSLINARTLYLVSTPPTPTDESSCFSKLKKLNSVESNNITL